MDVKMKLQYICKRSHHYEKETGNIIHDKYFDNSSNC